MTRKNTKIGNFALHKRKSYAYLPRNELHATSNRKISAYFTYAGYLIKDKTSYLKGSEFYIKNPREPYFDVLR
ncbi:hypothetical protein JOC76_001357 [Neobacillus cucumis]|nr:hypothetical protein [Neobacillus cucumis]